MDPFHFLECPASGICESWNHEFGELFFFHYPDLDVFSPKTLRLPNKTKKENVCVTKNYPPTTTFIIEITLNLKITMCVYILYIHSKSLLTPKIIHIQHSHPRFYRVATFWLWDVQKLKLLPFGVPPVLLVGWLVPCHISLETWWRKCAWGMTLL